jgi:hypothetical protein
MITVRRSRLDKLATVDLIDQYRLTLGNDGRRTDRRIFICNLLLERADRGDETADMWLASR